MNRFVTYLLHTMLFVSTSLACFASGEDSRRGHGWPGVTFKENKWTAKADYVKTSFETLTKIDNEIKALGGDGGDSEEAKKKKLAALFSLRKNILTQLDGSLNSKIGSALMKGLAGDQWKMLEDETVNDWKEGVQLGAATSFASACGGVFHDKMKSTINHVGGGFWDYCLGWMIDLWSDLGSVLFHGGHDPFERNELHMWGRLVQGCFKNVEKVAKNGLKDSSRGRDMTFRPTDDDDDHESEAASAEAKLTAWKLLNRGYADQLDHVINNIDTRIQYYEDNSEEVFYANQIKTRLIEFRDMLLASSSIKDFDDFIESNKSFIPALKDNVMSLFSHLIHKVTPRTYSLEKGGKTTEKSIFSNDDDDDDDSDAFGAFRRSW